MTGFTAIEKEDMVDGVEEIAETLKNFLNERPMLLDCRLFVRIPAIVLFRDSFSSFVSHRKARGYRGQDK